MAPFSQCSGYSGAMKPLDSQHINLFNMINELHLAMKDEHRDEAVPATLRKLLKYAKAHFAVEEQRLRISGDANLERHCALHRGLTTKVSDSLCRLGLGDEATDVDLLIFLCDWLETHIQLEEPEAPFGEMN